MYKNLKIIVAAIGMLCVGQLAMAASLSKDASNLKDALSTTQSNVMSRAQGVFPPAQVTAPATLELHVFKVPEQVTVANALSLQVFKVPQQVSLTNPLVLHIQPLVVNKEFAQKINPNAQSLQNKLIPPMSNTMSAQPVMGTGGGGLPSQQTPKLGLPTPQLPTSVANKPLVAPLAAPSEIANQQSAPTLTPPAEATPPVVPANAIGTKPSTDLLAPSRKKGLLNDKN